MSEWPLEFEEWQKPFMRDWWTPRKAFFGPRTSGKTTMLLCDMHRFLNASFKTVFICKNRSKVKKTEEFYKKLFGGWGDFDTATVSGVKNGGLRGGEYDVVFIDDIDRVDFETVNIHILPLNPYYIRAAGDLSHAEYFGSVFDKEYSSDKSLI